MKNGARLYVVSVQIVEGSPSISTTTTTTTKYVSSSNSSFAKCPAVKCILSNVWRSLHSRLDSLDTYTSPFSFAKNDCPQLHSASCNIYRPIFDVRSATWHIVFLSISGQLSASA